MSRFRFAQVFSAVDRSHLLDDALNLARAGLLDYPTALSVTNYLTSETHFFPWHSVKGALDYLTDMLYGHPDYYLLRVGVYSSFFPKIRHVFCTGGSRLIRTNKKLFHWGKFELSMQINTREIYMWFGQDFELTGNLGLSMFGLNGTHLCMYIHEYSKIELQRPLSSTWHRIMHVHSDWTCRKGHYPFRECWTPPTTVLSVRLCVLVSLSNGNRKCRRTKGFTILLQL